MAYADTVGIAAVYDGIRRLAAEHGARYWTAATLVVELGERNGSFAAWQAARIARS
jgi:hypothetical protein